MGAPAENWKRPYCKRREGELFIPACFASSNGLSLFQPSGRDEDKQGEGHYVYVDQQLMHAQVGILSVPVNLG